MTGLAARLDALARRFEAAAPLPDATPARAGDRRRAAIVSQLLHGETATRAACLRLAALHPSGAARRCLALQAADEARHAGAYAAYLAPLGGPGPADPGVLDALDAAATWPGPPVAGPLIANLIIESEAVRLQRRDLDALGCPALARLHGAIARDEARHVALARLLLRDALGGTDPATRAALAERARHLWWTCAEIALARHAGPFTRGLGRAVLAARWRRVERELGAVGLGPP